MYPLRAILEERSGGPTECVFHFGAWGLPTRKSSFESEVSTLGRWGTQPAETVPDGSRYIAIEDIVKTSVPVDSETKVWPISRFVPYARNALKNDAAVDRMAASIRDFGFKIPVLARSDGEVVDKHLRLKAAKKLGLKQVPVILCDEWSSAQVKAFRLMVNRSVTWAEWDEDLLSLELLELKGLDFDLGLTGFDGRELDALLRDPKADDQADQVPPLPEVAVTRSGDLWLLGPHRVLCGDSTSEEAVGRLLGAHKPSLMATDPPYGIELDSE